jgi:hypothetical protein
MAIISVIAEKYIDMEQQFKEKKDEKDGDEDEVLQ